MLALGIIKGKEGVNSFDLPIPGEPYTFGVVADAQALGDLQALQSLGRRVAGVHLQQGVEAGIAQLAGQLVHRR